MPTCGGLFSTKAKAQPQSGGVYVQRDVGVCACRASHRWIQSDFCPRLEGCCEECKAVGERGGGGGRSVGDGVPMYCLSSAVALNFFQVYSCYENIQFLREG